MAFKTKDLSVLAYANGPIDTPLAFTDDGIPVVLVRKSIRQQEHHTLVRISVDLTAPASSPLIVEYTTATVPAGVGVVPATPGSDFVAKASRLHFLPGETHHVISIMFVDDQVSEPDELFAVKLAGAFHANRRSIPPRVSRAISCAARWNGRPRRSDRRRARRCRPSARPI